MSKYIRIFLPVLLLTTLLIGIGCASPPPTGNTVDDLGRTVNIGQIPQRIISLAPSNTEILFALGLGGRVVGVTDYCDYPPEVEGKPSIGSFRTPNIEELVALSPDLILAASIHEEKVIPQLESRGLTVFALAPETIDEVLAAIIRVGEITGQENEASELTADMRNRIKAVTDKTDSIPQEQRPGVFYVVWHDPLMTAGTGTFQNDLIGMAGGINIARNLDEWADISLEAVIEANPEVIIVNEGHGSGGNLTLQFIKTEPRLRDTNARQNDRIYGIDGNLSSRPGPRIVEGLERFAEFIHPRLFEETR